MIKVLSFIFAFFVFVIFFIFCVMWLYSARYEGTEIVLRDDYRGKCYKAKQDLYARKMEKGSFLPKSFKAMPKPKRSNHVYIYDTLLSVGASDDPNSILFPKGTVFTLKNGYLSKIVGSSEHYFWMEPHEIDLDSSFLYYPSPYLKETEEFLSDEDYQSFGRMALFEEVSCS